MGRKLGGRALYRWGTLILAAIVWARCFGDARLAEFGWQFRLFEVWAVTATALSSALMVRLSMGWSHAAHAPLVGAVAGVNIVVVVLYLAPLGVFPGPSQGWHPVALGLVVPAMQIADALLILGAFRRLRGAAARVVAIAVGYVLWVELAVRPLNASAEGRGGLPYPLLDAMAPADRLGLYVAATALALAALPVLGLLQRWFGQAAADADERSIAA